MSDVRITVYMPTRNRAGLVVRAIEAVLAQSVRDFELLVVDDGSTDGTRAVLEAVSARDPRVKPLFQAAPAGACAARNRAIEMARGEWITGCDDDDHFLPHRLDAFLQGWSALEATGQRFSALYTDVRVLGPSGMAGTRSTPDLADADMLRVRNVVGNQVFTRTRFLRSCGGFDTSLPAWQDHDMWLRLAMAAGPLRRVGTASMVVDEAHDHARISSDRGPRIRRAYEHFVAKHGHLYRPRERALLALNYFAYAQVPMGLGDVVRGALAGAPRAYAGAWLAKRWRTRRA